MWPFSAIFLSFLLPITLYVSPHPSHPLTLHPSILPFPPFSQVDKLHSECSEVRRQLQHQEQETERAKQEGFIETERVCPALCLCVMILVRMQWPMYIRTCILPDCVDLLSPLTSPGLGWTLYNHRLFKMTVLVFRQSGFLHVSLCL